MQQLRGSVFSLTLMSKGEKRTGLPSLPSMPKGEIVGRFTVESKLVIDGKKNDGKNNDNGRGGATMNVGSYSESPMTVRYEFREE